MTRKEQAIKKFESSLTEKQKEIVKREILQEAIFEAHNIMEKQNKARLYPSINIEPSPSGLAMVMFNYGYYSRQLWGKGDDGEWCGYKYGD
jgi:hypothetical protein